MANEVQAFSSPYWSRPERPESVARNSARPVVTPDSERHAEQRALLEKIEQFVALSDYVQNFIDNYWDLDRVSAKFLHDPPNENFSEVMQKLDLTVRGLDQVSDALVQGLGHQLEDEEKVKECLGKLQHLYDEVMELADRQSETGDTKLTKAMSMIHNIADLARGRAIEVCHNVNTATQRRLDLLNQFFPEDTGKLGTDPIAQPSASLRALGDASTQSGGSFQIATQQLTRGISHDS